MAAYQYPNPTYEGTEVKRGISDRGTYGAPTRPWKEWSDWERKKFYDEHGFWPEQASFDPLSLGGAPARLQAQMEGVGEGEFYDPALRTLEGIERPPTAIQGSLVSATPTATAPDPSAVTPAAEPSQIPTIPSATGGLSGAAQGRLQALQNKWGGYMDAHAFATGATSRRKSFDSGIGSVFGTAKDDQFKEIESGNYNLTYHKNPATGVWKLIASSPKWQEKDPVTKVDKQGRLRYVTGPNKGAYVFPNEIIDPKTERDPNNRLRYMGGVRHGQLVFDPGETGKGIAKEYEPHEKVQLFQFGEGLFSEMAQARQYGLDSPEYIEAKRRYDLFTDQPGTEANVQRFRQINQLEAETERAAQDYGAGSPQHIAAQTNEKQFADLIAASDKQYQPKVTEFMRTSPDGTVEKFPGFIQWVPDNGDVKPIFKDMDGNVLTDVVQAPTTATTPAFLQKWQMHERLKRNAGWEPSPGELSSEFEKFMMNEQVVTQQGYGLADVRTLNNQIIATKTSTVTIGRILDQLANKNVTTGLVGNIFQGWEGVKDQALQLAITTVGTAWRSKGDNKYAIRVDERSLLDASIYKWNRGDLAAGLQPNIVYLAYSLARALDPSGRLSDFDVQVQIENITAGGNSKSKMASALKNIHNRLVEKMRFHYEGARNIQNMQLYNPDTGAIEALPNSFEEFLKQQNMVGRLMEFTINATGKRAIGYQVPVYDDKGELIGFEFEPIAQWEPMG